MVAIADTPMISVAAATGLPDAIERAGGNADEILLPLGLSRERLSTAHALIPAASFARALEDAARLTGDPSFGLHFGERYHPKNAGPLTYVVLNSPTMAVAFANIARYLRVHNEAAEVSFHQVDPWAYLGLRLDFPVEQCRQHTEFSLTVGVGLIRLMVGSGWAPVEVRFAHASPPDLTEHARVFGAPVTFGSGTNALVIEAEVCERDIPAADSRLYPIMLRYLDRILEAIPREDTLVAAVRRRIGAALRYGEPTLARVASELAIGPRTLQRKLEKCGVDFTELVADTRRRFAMQYLENHRNTLTDVAFLLGYSEVSAFNRAFKRWTGLTPLDHRDRQRSATPGEWSPPATAARTTKVRSRGGDRRAISTRRRAE